MFYKKLFSALGNHSSTTLTLASNITLRSVLNLPQFWKFSPFSTVLKSLSKLFALKTYFFAQKYAYDLTRAVCSTCTSSLPASQYTGDLTANRLQPSIHPFFLFTRTILKCMPLSYQQPSEHWWTCQQHHVQLDYQRCRVIWRCHCFIAKKLYTPTERFGTPSIPLAPNYVFAPLHTASYHIQLCTFVKFKRGTTWPSHSWESLSFTRGNWTSFLSLSSIFHATAFYVKLE